MDRVANQPLKITTPWASGAKAGFVRQVPNQSQIGLVNGAASFVDGFPPLTFTPVSAGGVPPYGQDMNGVLNQISAWSRWHQAGGLMRYDSAFQSAIAGYPAEARIGSNTTPYLIWQSTANNNMSNPDAGGGGWQTPVFPDVSATGKGIFPGATISAAAPGVNTSIGANLGMFGNTIQSDGRTAVAGPKKWLRVYNGTFALINDAYTAEIFSVDNIGNVSNIHDLTAGGQVSGGMLYSSGGAVIAGNIQAGSATINGTTTTGSVQINADATVNGRLTAQFITAWGPAYAITSHGINDTYGLNTTGFIYAGNSFSPNADRNHEWIFSVDPTYGSKFQQYRSLWYDAWDGQTGSRVWSGPTGQPAPNNVRGLMSLDGAGNWSVFGYALATGALYAGTYFSPNAYNAREWSFSVDGDGSKFQTYRNKWYDVWRGTDGHRFWFGDMGGVNGNLLMDLDGGGNLGVYQRVTANNMRTTLGATGTGDGNRVTNLNDFILGKGNPGYHIFPSGLIIQFGVVITGIGSGQAFNFPIAFPNVCISIVGCDDGSGMADIGITPWPSAPRNAFIVWTGYNGVYPNPPTYLGGVGVYYIAIGY
jgi:hypothetical protein